jgi:hypothetical protein
MTTVHVEFCGEDFPVEGEFVIGRDGDLQIDDNQFLHRRFLIISVRDDICWLSNVGSRLTATVSDAGGTFQGWLSPGAQLPIVFELTNVLFTAGPTTYEFAIHNPEASFVATSVATTPSGETTVGPVSFTLSQKLLIVALAEPLLRRDGVSVSAIPSSRAAAERLGWEITKFNRKLDNVCDKLDRYGIRGLRGGPGQLAVNRRARLVEHAVASRLVTSADLPLLDQPAGEENAPVSRVPTTTHTPATSRSQR